VITHVLQLGKLAQQALTHALLEIYDPTLLEHDELLQRSVKRWPHAAEWYADHETIKKSDKTPTWYIQASNAAYFHGFHAFI